MNSRNAVNILIILSVVAVVVGVARFKSGRELADETTVSTPEAFATTAPEAIGDESVKSSQPAKSLPRMVDLGAHKCIPCKMMAPILKELKAEYAGRAEIEFIDVWENPGAGREYEIRMIPTQIFFDASGKELFRHEGFFSKEDILKKFKEFGFDLDKGLRNE